MTTFLFWNVPQKGVEGIITSVVHAHVVDVLILAECVIPAGSMLLALNATTKRQFHLTKSGKCRRVTIYSRLPRTHVTSLEEHSDDKLTLRRLVLSRTEVLLAAVHLSSRRYYENPDKDSELRILGRAIRNAEEIVGHTRTVLLGDLNANPFDDGVVVADGLHGVMSRRIASKGFRKVASKTYPFFYNPMWGHFGESTGGPSGTYYRAGSTFEELFWHMWDQVLLRRDLLEFFKDEDLKVLASDGGKSLLKRTGIPSKSVASDHLPILFRLDL